MPRKRKDDWSKKRRESNRLIAFVIESIGKEWTSIREAVPFISEVCRVDREGRLRSEVVVECAAVFTQQGFVPPDDYVPPWLRPIGTYHSWRPKARSAKFNVFYESWEWCQLRYSTLKERGRRCECCGLTPQDGVKLHVDHIKPIRLYWSLRLDPTNLQILCEGCNKGKGYKDETDWRNQTEQVAR